jgi:hypothetical protein
MGQQQILLIVLSVILVGIAIAVGISMFRAQARNSNLDGIISDLNNLGSIAYQYKIRPVSMGGGGGEYDNFDGENGYFANLPDEMKKTDNLSADDTYQALVTGEGAAAIVWIGGYNTTYEHGRRIRVDADGAMQVFSWDGTGNLDGTE